MGEDENQLLTRCCAIRTGRIVYAYVYRFEVPMSATQSEDAFRAEFKEELGHENGEIYFVLYSDVFWLHAKWGEYRKLFGTSEKRLELLNSTAGYFFNVIQHALWDDMLLAITRLLDPISQMSGDNLTMGRLPLICKHDDLKAILTADIDALRKAATFAKLPRNRLIAHRDLPTAIDELADSIPKGSRTEVATIIAGIENALHLFHEAHFNSQMTFGRYDPPGDGNALVHELAWAAMQRQHQSERFAMQTPLPTDFDEPRLD